MIKIQPHDQELNEAIVELVTEGIYVIAPILS